MPISVAIDYIRTAQNMAECAKGDIESGDYSRALQELGIAQRDIQSAIEHAERAQIGTASDGR